MEGAFLCAGVKMLQRFFSGLAPFELVSGLDSVFMELYIGVPEAN